MIESTIHASIERTSPVQAEEKPRRVLRMVENERTAGSIPSWSAPRTAQQDIESTIGRSLRQSDSDGGFSAVLAYQEQTENQYIDDHQSEEFGFGDLVDMINPLQHIPLLSSLYRELTGDEIKPIGKIIGGAVFGGPAGAAGGLVNVVIEEETGKDITGNALALVKDGPERPAQEMPEKRLAQAITEEQAAYEDLPAALLAFADSKATLPPQKQVLAAGGRTAGYVVRYV